MTARIVIAGGGTAGHVYPGLALAQAILELRPDASISFVGTSRGIETAAVPAAGFRLHLVNVVPFSSSLGAKRFLAPASLVTAARAARNVLRAERAAAVAGMGGYASVPVALAARWSRVPCVLHEQNAIPGIANLVSARFTPNIALSYEEARTRFPKSARVRVTGNPIRASVANADRAALRAEARAALGAGQGTRLLVLFGGSLGAARLNDAAVSLAERWKGRTDVEAVVITGPKHEDAVTSRLPADGPVRTVSYLDRMEHAYAAADVVVCRAGAATIAELAATGTPAVLVPYPYARADHQTANARPLVSAGGAVLVSDTEATPERIAAVVEELLGQPSRLEAMSRAAGTYAKPYAARDLAAWVLELAEAGR